MSIVKKTLAWLLAVTMLVTSVDYVHATEAVHESQEIVTTEVSQGDSSAEAFATGDGETVSTGEILYSGTEAGITWSITVDGLLTIGGTYDGESGEEVKCSWLDHKEDIKKAVVTAKNVEDTTEWFRECSQLTEIDFSKFDTANVTSMTYMFYDCSALTSLNLSGFDTGKVTNMSFMFDGCSSLTSLNLGGFDTSSVTTMWYMFSGCSSLTGLDLSDFNTGNVTNMSYMFDGCSKLSSLDVSGFDTSKVTNMSGMFGECSSLTGLDLDSFDTSKVTNMSNMFEDCSNLTSLDLSSFNTGNVTKMSNMFYDCSGLTSLDLRNFNTSKVTGMSGMFSGCTGLTSLDLSSFNTSKVTSMSGVFYECSSLTGLDLGSFNTSKVTSMSSMFSGCASLTGLDFSNFNTSKVTNMSRMFYECSSLTALDLSNFDTGEVTHMSYMFDECSRLTSLDLSSFNTSKLSDAKLMLSGCKGLIELKCMPDLLLDISLPHAMQDIDGNVYGTYLPKNMSEGIWLYAQCDRKGEVSGLEWTLFDNGVLIITGEYDATAAVEGSVLPWHEYASDIKTVTIEAKGVESTAYWFAGCSMLQKVDLSQFDTSKVTNMEAMFKNCYNLKSLDVSELDMSKVVNAADMFLGCTNLDSVKTFRNLNISIKLPHYMVAEQEGVYTEYTEFPQGLEKSLLLEVSSFHGTVDGLRWYIFYQTDTLYITGENTNTEIPDEATEYPWKQKTDYTNSYYSKVVIDAKGVISTAHWFENYTNIKEIDVSNFDVASLVDTTDMLKGCTSLEKVKTFKNLSVSVALPFTMYDDRAGAYAVCPLNVTEDLWIYKRDRAGEIQGIGWVLLEDGTLVIGGSDTSTEASTSTTWPWHTYKDKTLNVKIYARNVKSTAYWFLDCTKITAIDCSEFDTSSVQNMKGMFRGCSGLKILDLSGFNMKSVTAASMMLDGCTAMETIYAPKNLALDVALPSRMTDAEFNLYAKLPKNKAESIVLGTGQILASGIYYGMDWAALKDGRLIIAGTYSEALDTDTSWKAYAADIKSVKVTAKGVKSTKEWFDGLSKLESVDFSGFDTSKVTDMSAMFRGCSSLKTLDLSGFNTGSVTKMRNMFNKCEALTTVNISSLNTSKVTDMGYLFYGCTSLESVDVSTWNTASLTDMTAMFTNCSKLSELDLSNFCTEKVKKISHMFRGCSSLKTLDLSFLDFSNFTTFTRLLDGCTGLLEIHMPANLSVDIEVPKTLYNYLGEPQTDIFPKYQPEAEWYYAVSPVGEGEIHVSKVYPQTYTGKAIKPEIRIYDGANRLLDKKDFTITYKNNTKAASHDAVNAKGKSIAPTIIVKGKGNYTKTETITFDILAKDISAEDVTVNELAAVAGKKVQKPVPKLTYNGKKLVNKKDFTVSYPDLEDESKVDAYKAPGTYRVVVTGKGNFTGTRELTFTITGGTLMSKVKIAKLPNQTYTGAAIEPEIKVTHGKKVLVKGTDYTVSYAKNVEIGKATVTVTGMGSYAGSKSATFQITGQSIAKAKVEGIEAKTYNGQAQTQSITVTLKGQEKPLVAGADYEVVYTKNISAGTATMTITGKGSYTGKIKKTFKINAYDLAVDESKLLAGVPEALTVSYEKGGSKPALSLTFDGADLAVKKDYTLSYANNKKVAGADAAKAPTITVKGKGNFKGSIKIPFSIVAKNLQDAKNPVKINVPDVAYSKTKGKYISKPVLTDSNGKKLVAGTDYEKEVVYTLADGTVLDKKSVVEAGRTVTVTVTGKGNYSGTISATYRITQASFKSAKIKIAPQVYTGKEITLSGEDFTSVKIGKDTLVYGEDFEIVEGSYKNNVKKGTASVTIKGKGNYGGEKTVKFKIVPKELIWFWRLFE